LLLVTFLVVVTGQAQTTNILVGDLPYGAEPYKLLDVYHRDGASNDPVMVLIHGQASDKTDWAPFRGFFLDNGFIVVTPQWQGSTATMTDPIADMAQACVWVAGNIGQYGGDPTRINIGGTSAGAYIGAMLAYARELDIRVFLGLAGLYRADPFINGEKERPVEFVTPADPATFLGHGEIDERASPQESVTLASRLDAAGVENDLYILPGVGHADIKTAVFFDPNFQHVRDALSVFLRRMNDLSVPTTVFVEATDNAAAEPGTDMGAITVARFGDTAVPLTVSYTLAGSAGSGVDYAALPGTITIPAGSALTNIVIRPINDATPECDETVVLTLPASPNYFIDPLRATALVTIADNDLPTIRLSVADASAAETNADTARFVFARSGCTNDPLAVGYAIAGTANNGVDYLALPGVVTFAAGTNSQSVTVTPIDDTQFEGDETVDITLLPGTGYNVGSSNTLTVTIADNDAAPVQPTLARSPAALPAQAIVAGENAPTQNFQVWNAGSGALNYTLTDDAAWLSLSALAGASGGATNLHSVFYNTAALSPGSYTATITITGANGALNSPQTIGVTLNVGACVYEVAPTIRNVGSLSGTATLSVNTSAGCAWTAAAGSPWITIMAGSGSGTGTVTFAVAANTDCAPRAGLISAAGQAVTINQSAGAGVFTIAPTSRAHSAAAEGGTINVSVSGASCAWVATSNAPWITVTLGASGTGDGVVSYAISANAGCLPRTGTLTVAGQTFTVTQAGSTGSFTTSPTSRAHPAASGAGTISVTASSADCSWHASSNAAWLTITSGASGTGDGVVSYNVNANLSCQPRSGTLTVAGQTFTVTQAAGAGNVALSPPGRQHSASGETGAITVNPSSGNCAWTAATGSSWITIASGASGTGTGAINYAVAANLSTNTRAGAITVQNQTFTITQGGVVGAGLLGEYYAGTAFATQLLTRVDAAVNFDWSFGAPDAAVPTDRFSVRWTGKIIPQFSEDYTFRTVNDDGARLWINGVQLINDWTGHPPQTNTSAAVALVAGQAYDIVMEYFEGTSTAVAKLLWSSASQPLEAVPASQLIPTQTGLRGEYFAGTSLATQRLVRVDAAIDFNWGFGPPNPSVPGDGFSARWTGRIVPRFTDSYTFQSVNDDGLRVWIDGNLVISDWAAHPPATNTSAAVALMAGQPYDITVEYFENTSSAVAQLYWSSPQQPKQIVPATQFRTESAGQQRGLRGQYFTDTGMATQKLVRVDAAIDFNWAFGAPATTMPTDKFAVRWTGKIVPASSESYTFHTVTDDGARLWVNGQLLVNDWNNHATTTNTSVAVALMAGQTYDIRFEYYDNVSEAIARLLWSTPTLPRQVIPAAQLVPATADTP
jgi:acetyl esterase/lipase